MPGDSDGALPLGLASLDDAVVRQREPMDDAALRLLGRLSGAVGWMD